MANSIKTKVPMDLAMEVAYWFIRNPIEREESQK